MKNFFKIPLNLGNFFSIFLFFLILIFQINDQSIHALIMNKYQNEEVTEELRLKIPSESKEVWLNAEKNIWEPWLSSQDGYLGRQLFWDKEREEALILVKWKNKKLWKNISITEVNKIQKKFEDNVKTALNVRENPFELIYEGELNNQG